MKNRKVTGTLGAIVAIACLALVFIGKATLTEVSGFLLGSAALFGSKDELFLKNFTSKKDKSQDDETR